MTHLNSPAPGTACSVPEVVNPVQTAAAMQALWAAMHQLQNQVGAAYSPMVPTSVPASPALAPRIPVIQSGAADPQVLPTSSSTPSAAPPTMSSTTLANASAVGDFCTQAPWVAGPVYHVMPSSPLALAIFGENEPDGPWYCITRGLHVGVTLSNAIAIAAISGVSCAAMSKHKTQAQAVAAFNEALNFGLVAILNL